MAFISGPRQVGKTTLGKQLLTDKNNYFSWDQTAFRKIWTQFPEKVLEKIGEGPILFDEIHKDRKWKSKIKGIYDTYSDEISILVTGSAKLDIYRKGSDSLLGRYIPYRLHPFSVSESHAPSKPNNILKRFKVSYKWKDLMVLGSYPEPLLSGKEKKAQRWSRLRLDRLAYEDTRDVKILSDLNAFRVLLDLIPEKVGSLFSFNSLKEDVGVAYATVREWVLLSEMLYYGFFVRPYSKGLKRSLRSEPKFYLYDILQIPKSETAKRLENLTALHLIKICHFWTDTGEGLFDLFFVRNKEKKEVDFLITKDKHPWMLIECKTQSKGLSSNLLYYSEKLKTSLNFQLIDNEKYDKNHRFQKVRVMGYEKFFSGLI
ncbi:MAG: AAA family ATPase [Bdellovibrionales bacterium]|nr:AAA family ATPase [Bdellovibrionales bacterium]